MTFHHKQLRRRDTLAAAELTFTTHGAVPAARKQERRVGRASLRKVEDLWKGTYENARKHIWDKLILFETH